MLTGDALFRSAKLGTSFMGAGMTAPAFAASIS
jgi:hypothetical protein